MQWQNNGVKNKNIMAINGFEKETEKLSVEERRLIKPILNIIGSRKSKSEAVKNHEISQLIIDQGYVQKLPASRVRKLIHHIRVNRLLEGILATSKGYHVSKDSKEVLEYIESLKQREQAIKDVRQSTALYYHSLFEQKKLF